MFNLNYWEFFVCKAFPNSFFSFECSLVYLALDVGFVIFRIFLVDVMLYFPLDFPHFFYNYCNRVRLPVYFYISQNLFIIWLDFFFFRLNSIEWLCVGDLSSKKICVCFFSWFFIAELRQEHAKRKLIIVGYRHFFLFRTATNLLH